MDGLSRIKLKRVAWYTLLIHYGPFIQICDFCSLTKSSLDITGQSGFMGCDDFIDIYFVMTYVP